MFDLLKILFCGVGIVYLAIRIGGLVHSIIRGYRTVVHERTAANSISRPDLPGHRQHRDADSHTREHATV